MEKIFKMIRLDKFLADMDIGTRSEVKKYIKKGLITINGEIVKTPEIKIQDFDKVTYLGVEVKYKKYVYYMLNKPAGVVSATEDKRDKTVLDLLKGVATKDVFPVGRLDKDTEGLLLLTNDGALAHNLLSPKKHVDKTYYAKINGVVDQSDIEMFLDGIDIGEKNLTLPSELHILTSSDISDVEVTIHEGKFHQIKRMFHAVGKEVIYLKRLQMGSLILDNELPLGGFRKLTDEEIRSLC
ncbi:MAG: pseudouridine synthase [Eubacteriales bacterium]